MKKQTALTDICTLQKRMSGYIVEKSCKVLLNRLKCEMSILLLLVNAVLIDRIKWLNSESIFAKKERVWLFQLKMTLMRIIAYYRIDLCIGCIFIFKTFQNTLRCISRTPYSVNGVRYFQGMISSEHWYTTGTFILLMFILCKCCVIGNHTLSPYMYIWKKCFAW